MQGFPPRAGISNREHYDMNKNAFCIFEVNIEDKLNCYLPCVKNF